MQAETKALNGEPDYFCWLLDRAMPRKKGLAVVLEAYFDASERGSEMFSVAGLAFDADAAKQATSAWIDLWGDTRCHMTDLHSGRNRAGNPFYGWDDAKAGDRLKASIQIINDHVAYAVATSCRVSDIARLAPKSAPQGSEMFLDSFQAAYPLCCTLAMSALGNLMDKAGDPSDVAYFFEKGDLNQGASQRFIENATSTEYDGANEIKSSFHHRSHTVMAKDDSRLFEMADIFAWEQAKHMERLIQGKTAMRGSLRALLGDGVHGESDFKSTTRRTFHNAGPMFAKYMQDIQIGIFTS